MGRIKEISMIENSPEFDAFRALDAMQVIEDLPAEEYHAHSAYGSTFVKDIVSHGLQYADNRRKTSTQPTPAMQLGTVLHSLILEGKTEYTVRPKDLKLTTKEGKSWKAEHAGELILSWEDGERVANVASSVLSNNEAQKILGRAPIREVSFFTHIDSVPWKVRADAFGGRYTAPEIFVDLKTTSNFENWEKHALDLAYDVQASWYTLPWRLAGCKPQFFFIVAETNAPYRVAVVEQVEFSRLVDEMKLLEKYVNASERVIGQERWRWTLSSPPAWLQGKREKMIDVSMRTLSKYYDTETEAV